MKQLQTEVCYWGLKKQGRNFSRGQQMQCGLSAVWSRPRRLPPNNLMQPEQAVREATRLPSPVNHRWQPKTHRSITEPRCTVQIHVADEHRYRGDRYRRGAAKHSPYYKWRRCFWQSFSLQCPLRRHLQENKHGFRGRRRWETTLDRSRGRRPDCNPDRQRAATETRSIMRPPARSWGSGRHSASTRLHPRPPFSLKKHDSASEHDRVENGPSYGQQVVSSYQESTSAYQRWSTAHIL